MTFKFEVPSDPTDNGRWWIKDYTRKSEFLSSKIPFIKMPLSSTTSRAVYWTLDPKFHNFFKHHNIVYRLDYTEHPHAWYISIDEKDELLFKLCWISAEDVYNNF